MENSTRKSVEKDIVVGGDRISLEGHLVLPESAAALILFAHGSGSGRFSPRNSTVAKAFQEHGFGTLMIDLLTEEDIETRSSLFSIELLASRLLLVKNWAQAQPETKSLMIGYFGSSTGAAAALEAAAKEPEGIFAVVSRGGRPDLASAHLANVNAPTLLIVGGEDEGVIDLNFEALRGLRCVKKIEIIPGATHLFEEQGAMGRVTDLALNWFHQFSKESQKIA